MAQADHFVIYVIYNIYLSVKYCGKCVFLIKKEKKTAHSGYAEIQVKTLFFSLELCIVYTKFILV